MLPAGVLRREWGRGQARLPTQGAEVLKDNLLICLLAGRVLLEGREGNPFIS